MPLGPAIPSAGWQKHPFPGCVSASTLGLNGTGSVTGTLDAGWEDEGQCRAQCTAVLGKSTGQARLQKRVDSVNRRRANGRT